MEAAAEPVEGALGEVASEVGSLVGVRTARRRASSDSGSRGGS